MKRLLKSLLLITVTFMVLSGTTVMAEDKELGCIPETVEEARESAHGYLEKKTYVNDETSGEMSAQSVGSYSSGRPSKVDLSNEMPIPGNQGRLGSCSAWAVAYACKTQQEFRSNFGDPKQRKEKYSPSYIYNQLTKNGSGISISSAFNLLLKEGVCALEDMPYNDKDYQTKPNATQKKLASSHKIGDYTSMGGTENMKEFLARGHAVVISIPVYEKLYNLNSSDPVLGIDDIKNDVPKEKREYHAVCLVGYDDSMKAFRFINSWGTSYGVRGYGYISYAFIDSPSIEVIGYAITDDCETKPDSLLKTLSGDFDLDGRDDICEIYNCGNSIMKFRVTTAESSDSKLWYTSELGDFDINRIQGNIVAGDFNGDNLCDIGMLYNNDTNQTRLYVFKSKDSYFECEEWSSSQNSNLDEKAIDGRVVAGYFDDDKYCDIAVIYDNGDNTTSIYTFKSNGSTFVCSCWYKSQHEEIIASRITNRCTVGDFDNDHLNDIAVMYDCGNSQAKIITFTSARTCFYTQPRYDSGYGKFDATKVNGRFNATDINNDGRCEIVALYDKGDANSELVIFERKEFEFTCRRISDVFLNGYSTDLVGSNMLIAKRRVNGVYTNSILTRYQTTARQHAYHIWSISDDGSLVKNTWVLPKKIDDVQPEMSSPIIENIHEKSFVIKYNVNDDNKVCKVRFKLKANKEGTEPIWYDAYVDGSNAWRVITISDFCSDYYSDYTVNAYAYDYAGNVTEREDIFELDESAPIISNINVTNQTVNGFTVSCDIKEDCKMKEMHCVVWTDKNGQDDKHTSIMKFDQAKGKAWVDILTSSHNYENGKYYYTIYASDANDNVSCKGKFTVTLTEIKPMISNITYTNVNANGFSFTCQKSNALPIDRVRLAIWTDNNGQDDLKWYDCYINGNTVWLNISSSNHNYETQKYIVHVYVYDTKGNCKSYGSAVSLSDKAAPSVTSMEYTNVSENGFRFQCNVADNIEVDRIRFAIWTDNKGQDDLVWCDANYKNGKAWLDVNKFDHKFENGLYIIHVYAYDTAGNLKCVGSTYNYWC